MKSETLQELMTEAGVSIRALAKEVGKSEVHVSKQIKGQVPLTPDILWELQRMGVDVAGFFGKDSKLTKLEAIELAKEFNKERGLVSKQDNASQYMIKILASDERSQVFLDAVALYRLSGNYNASYSDIVLDLMEKVLKDLGE